MRNRKKIIVVGPRRTATTSLFEMFRMRPFKKALPPPENFFSYMIMRIHTNRYGHYICPDILHSKNSIDYIVKNKKKFHEYKFVRLIRERNSHLKSLQALDARYGSSVKSFENELLNVENNYKVLKNVIKVEEIDLIGMLKRKEGQCIIDVFGGNIRLDFKPKNIKDEFVYYKFRPPQALFLLYQYIMGFLGMFLYNKN